MCQDPDGASFSLGNLEDCIEGTHEQKADEMLSIEYPSGPAAPTPTPTATQTAGGGVTATRTSTPGGPTSTPTPANCAVPNPLPEVVSLVAKPGLDLDIGWTGISHDGEGSDDSTVAAVRVQNCDTNTSSPT